MTDPAQIDKLCAEGRDAARFLTQYVVQAELNERGNYGALPCPAHSFAVALAAVWQGK